MKKIRFLCLIIAGCFFASSFISCSTDVSKENYITYYDSHCTQTVNMGGFEFKAMALNSDYEMIKWGTPLDSGQRVLFWVYPRSEGFFKEVFLTSDQDTIKNLAFSKIPLFEMGNTDSFVIAFPTGVKKAKLHVQNYNDKVGNVVILLKDCQNIRIKK